MAAQLSEVDYFNEKSAAFTNNKRVFQEFLEEVRGGALARAATRRAALTARSGPGLPFTRGVCVCARVRVRSKMRNTVP